VLRVWLYHWLKQSLPGSRTNAKSQKGDKYALFQFPKDEVYDTNG